MEAKHIATPLVDALMAKWTDDGATRGPAFIELRDLARELERDLKAANEAFSLWYFVMDEAPGPFEEIVSFHPPARWMAMAHELRRATLSKAGA